MQQEFVIQSSSSSLSSSLLLLFENKKKVERRLFWCGIIIISLNCSSRFLFYYIYILYRSICWEQFYFIFWLWTILFTLLLFVLCWNCCSSLLNCLFGRTQATNYFFCFVCVVFSINCVQSIKNESNAPPNLKKKIECDACATWQISRVEQQPQKDLNFFFVGFMV